MRYKVNPVTKQRPPKKPAKPVAEKTSKLLNHPIANRQFRVNDWQPYGGMWTKGWLLKVGEVTCTVDPVTDRGREQYNATVCYTEIDSSYIKGVHVKDYNRSFSYEDEAKRWCLMEALELQGFIFEQVLVLKENVSRKSRGRIKDRPHRLNFKIPMKIDIGRAKIRTEMTERAAYELLETLKIHVNSTKR